MRQVFVTLAVGLPLALALIFIVNNVVSETFPLFGSSPMDETDYLKQTYEGGLDYCKNKYKNINTIETNQAYKECIELVETWHTENLK